MPKMQAKSTKILGANSGSSHLRRRRRTGRRTNRSYNRAI